MKIDTSAMGLHVYPAPILKKRAEAIALPLPENIEAVAERMFDIMDDYHGIGLAGPQAGLSLRIIVYDLSEDGSGAQVLINPEIVDCDKAKVKSEEGCLSFPEINGTVDRNKSVTVRGLRLDGEEVELQAEGLEGYMFQHEIDHLNGVTFVDRLGPTGKMRVKRQLEELEHS